MVTKFTNGYLCDNGVLVKQDLYIDDATHRIIDRPVDSSVVTSVVDLKNQILAPGYLDIQNNGIYGVNFSNLSSNSTATDVANFKAKYHDAMHKYLSTGVTAICPTVTSNFPDVYPKVLPIYRKNYSTEECDSLGAHLEGPFINLKKKGCHPTETFVDASKGQSSLNAIYGDDANLKNVCIITAAPEVPGMLQLIPQITKHNITFSIGHTMADYDTSVAAVQSGATMITHLYNAMPQPHHRDVGVVGLITSPKVKETPYFGMICDDVHVAPSMAILAYKSNPDKTILVTDTMHLIGLPDGTYKWDNQTLVKEGFKIYLQGTSTLAGAATTLAQCVRNLMAWCEISLAEAVKTVTNNPAESLGLQNERGFLKPGCVADFVVLDNSGYVQSVYKAGKRFNSSDIPDSKTLRAAL